MAENEYKALDLKPKSVNEQVKRLRKLFPNSKFQESEKSDEQGFVIPTWSSIACSYQKALEKVFDRIGKLEGIEFSNWHLGKQDENNLRHNTRTISIFNSVLESQAHGNYVVANAHMGKHSLGKSPNEVLAEIDGGVNFGLTGFHVGIIILTHFDRIAGRGDMWINCLGDEIITSTKNEFNGVPFYTITNKKIWFCGHDRNCKFDRFGSATTMF